MCGPLPRRSYHENPCARRQKQGRPLKLKLTAGQKSDIASAAEMIVDLPKGAMLLADKGYDANTLREMATVRGAWANFPPKANRKDSICFRRRHLVSTSSMVDT